MKTATQFFAAYFKISESEAKGCNHMAIECMKEFAKEACREQREICADHYKFASDEAEFTTWAFGAIKNAHEPKMK